MNYAHMLFVMKHTAIEDAGLGCHEMELNEGSS